MKSNEVRSSFIKYFEKREHRHVSSSRLVPENDPTLLFTNAGMNQFKNTFLGLEKRDYDRAVSSQKCVRAGGKHNDLENVGRTARHHTFFEMLGNFSFGDYFKKEAIHFAWEFITKELGIDKDRLYVTVFTEDDEAADIWNKQEGVSKDRIYRFGEKDNFWRMGDTGPCGPCSEIFIDLGPDVGGDPKDNVMGGEGDRFMEFWNLVFMQFNEDEFGKKHPLPKPSVDTGMGLERLTTILQGELSNYHTDLFTDLMDRAAKISGVSYVKNLKQLDPKKIKSVNEQNIALRVLADHARASAFLIGDGVLPSNDGRGYVLRRILRRGIRFGRKLTDQSLMPNVVEAVISKMSDFYPELQQQSSLILGTIKDEEKRFLQTLDQGTEILDDELNRLDRKGQKVLDGDTVFKLYDTYGFPADLTRLMAEEKGFGVDEATFEKRMAEAREVAKASWKGKSISGDAAHLVEFTQKLARSHGATQFTGYETLGQSGAKIIGLSDGSRDVTALKSGDSGVLVTDRTCFYAEGGGQVGDSGKVDTSSGSAQVLDCTKQNDIFLHHIQVTDGEIKLESEAHLLVQDSQRRLTAANHSATHLLHAALKTVLGSHVQQAGSLVDSERLRFDFTHNKPMTKEEIAQVEDLVNQEVGKATEVQSRVIPHQQALDEGAVAMFGEKYGDEVRVIKMGPFSMELCGGTHVSNTTMIRLFKIVSESGVSSGVRRIEALTSDRATEYLLKNTQENLEAREFAGISENWGQYLKESSTSVRQQIEHLKTQVKDLQKKIQSLQGQKIDVDDLLAEAQTFTQNGIKGRLVLADIPMEDRKVLSDISDKLKNKVGSGIVVIIGQGEKSHPLIVSVSKDLTSSFSAGQLLKEVATTLGGKGGGRPDFAQGAAPHRSDLIKAFQRVREIVGVQNI